MNYLAYTAIEGDRWDLLAWKAYADPLAYQTIIDANPDLAIYETLPAGVSVNIPIIAEAQVINEENLPPWKR